MHKTDRKRAQSTRSLGTELSMNGMQADHGDGDCVTQAPTLMNILFDNAGLMHRILGTANYTLEGDYVYYTSEGLVREEPTSSESDDDVVRFTTASCRTWVQVSQVCQRAATCLQRRMVRVRHENLESQLDHLHSISESVDDLQEAFVFGDVQLRHYTGSHWPDVAAAKREIRLEFNCWSSAKKALRALRRVLVANRGVSII